MNVLEKVRTPEQALVYLGDCTLATVVSLAMLKSRNQSEFERQISMAQQGIDWLVQMGIETMSTRAEDVINLYSDSVLKYSEKFDVKLKNHD